FPSPEHGCGPVSSDRAEGGQGGVQQVGAGPVVQEPYASRAASTCPLPRFGASKRTVAAIERIGYRGTRKELETPVPTPKAPPIAYGQSPCPHPAISHPDPSPRMADTRLLCPLQPVAPDYACDARTPYWRNA